MATNYKQPGEVLELTAPAGGVVSGTAYKIGQFLVIALVTASAGEKFSGACCGVWELPKVSAQAWTEGALVYWDDTAKNVTTVATGKLCIGVAAAAAANPSATGLVLLNGIGQANAA